MVYKVGRGERGRREDGHGNMLKEQVVKGEEREERKAMFSNSVVKGSEFLKRHEGLNAVFFFQIL